MNASHKSSRAFIATLSVLFAALAAAPAYAQIDPTYTDVYGTPSYTDVYGTPSYTDVYGTPTYTDVYPSDYSLGYTPSYDYGSFGGPVSGYSIGYTNPMGGMTGNIQKQDQSQGQSQGQTSTNTNANTSTNTNTSQSNNTNNNQSSASASTGPINISNVNNNVVNVPPTQVILGAPQQTFQTPTCTLSVSNAGYFSGYYANQPMTLAWSSTGATSGYISPSVGTVAPSGSTTVYPNGYTSYTMTVYGPGGTNTCYTNAYATPILYNTPVAPVYQAPIAHPVVAPAPVVVNHAPAVSLSQIPYTGFDYGPVGNSIYWAALLAFAAAAAYLMVYYLPVQAGQGGAFAFSRSFVNQSTVTVDEDEEETEITEEPEDILGSVLPIANPARVTIDSMIMHQASGNAGPRIVIARA